jgi:hypothetical protein
MGAIDWNNFIPDNIKEAEIVGKDDTALIHKLNKVEISFENKIRFYTGDNGRSVRKDTKYPTVTYDVEMIEEERNKLSSILFSGIFCNDKSLTIKSSIIKITLNDAIYGDFYPCFVQTVPFMLTDMDIRRRVPRITVIVHVDDTRYAKIQRISDLRGTTDFNRFDLLDLDDE